jgi:hypothetical protein
MGETVLLLPQEWGVGGRFRRYFVEFVI